MSSGHHPANFHLQDASEYQSPIDDGLSIAPMHSDALDLEQFMMGSDHQSSRNPSLTTPPHLEALQQQQQQQQPQHHHSSPFSDFSFPYSSIPDNGMHGEHQLGSHSHVDNIPGHDSQPAHRSSVTSMPGDHRNSVTSVPGDHRLSVTSVSAPPAVMGSRQKRHISVSGSDDASPTASRPGGGGYNDDFGLLGGGAVDGSEPGPRSKEDKNDPTPAWTEMKTKAGKERKRLPLACIACRRKKIRCSGEKPACKHCIRSRVPCVYKVTTRKAAPRTDYMAMLDKRLKRMEDRIIKIVPIEEQAATTASVARANVKPGVPGASTSPTTTSGRKRGAAEAFGPNLEEWANFASGPTIVVAKPPSLLLQEAEESKLLSEGSELLPSQEIQEHLAEVFFGNIYGQTYHLLHKPSYMRKLRSGTLPPVLVLAVCAISARFSTHPKLNTQPAFLRGEEWASKAREIVMRRYEWPNITILTCLLILGLHEFGTCHGGRSWSLGGQAIRMAYALQLHQDLDYDPQKRNGTVELSFIDREIRRRTMWSCFLMDRFNSSGTERPTFIKEETIKVQLPIREKFFQLDMPGPTEDLEGNVPHAISPGAGQLSNARDNMGVAAYMIRSIALWGRIINYLNLGGNERDRFPMWHPDSQYTVLIRQTEEFDQSLPECLSYSEENLHTHQTEGLDNQFLFLHISMQQNILFMNRFAVPTQPGGNPPKDVPKDFVTQAGAKAFRSANRISEILQDASAHFVTAPFAGYCAFLSSTVHVFGVFSKNPAMEAVCKKNLAINVTYITKMKRYWGMFHWMAENLKEQYRFFAEIAKKGPSAGGEHASSPIFQYGDWFDRYPHGVSHSDYEDPSASGTKKEKGEDAVLGGSKKSDYATVEEFFSTLVPPPPRTTDAALKALKHGRSKRSKSDQPNPVNTDMRSFSQPLQMQQQQMQQPQQQQPQRQQPQQHHHHQQQQQSFSEISPTSLVDMYPQPFSDLDLGHIASLPQQSLMPHLDRQFVFGAYANMDPSSLSSQTILDSVSWEMNLGGGGGGGGGINGGGADGSSAWFMPFNMIPPEISIEADAFPVSGAGGEFSGLGGNIGGGGAYANMEGMGAEGHGVN